MSIELLEVIQAETAAEALLKQAQDARESAIKQTLANRERVLADIKAPAVNVPELPPLRPNLNALQDIAKKNQEKAIKRIMEEIYAA